MGLPGTAPATAQAASPAPPGATCPLCGYPRPETRCSRCGDRALTFDGSKAVRPGPGFFVADFAHGFWAYFAGALALINRKEFVGKLWLPITVNLAVLAVAFGTIGYGFWALFDWMFAGDWGWFEFAHEWVSWASTAISFLLAAIAMVFLSPVLIELITGPFLDPIAAITERIHGGERMQEVERPFWQSMAAGVRSSAQILLYQLFVLLPCLILSLFGVGLVLALIAGAWFNAMVWFDVPVARRGFGLTQRRRLLRRNWARAMGFGFAYQLALFVPVFNFVFLAPAAAVAASSLYFHFEKPDAGNTVPDSTAPDRPS